MNTYGLFLTLAITVGITNFYLIAHKLRQRNERLLEDILVIFIIGFLSARLTYILLYSDQFANWLDWLAIWQGGLVSFGGLIGGILTSFWRFKGPNRWFWFDNLTLSFFLGWIFGRIGGFLTQNAVGVISPNFGTFFYNRVPIQLFESLLAALVYLIGLVILKKYSVKRAGLIFAFSFVGYGLGRFIIDFWREEPILIFFLKSGQIISLSLVFYGIILLLEKKKINSS